MSKLTDQQQQELRERLADDSERFKAWFSAEGYSFIRWEQDGWACWEAAASPLLVQIAELEKQLESFEQIPCGLCGAHDITIYRKRQGGEVKP